VFLTKLTQSSYFRFASAIAAVFLVAYFGASAVAFHAINQNLKTRVVQVAQLASATYEDQYQVGGLGELISTINSDIKTKHADDVVVWLGKADGSFLAGQQLKDPLFLRSGDYPGDVLADNIDDRFHVEVREFDHLRLVTGNSYEESNDIRDVVTSAYAGATIVAFALACLAIFTLARQGQLRIDRIRSVLKRVALGQLDKRIEISQTHDDLNILAVEINSALSQLQTTVDEIKQVSVNIAHDLRTPLNRLSLHVDRLKQLESQYPDLEQALRQINADIHLMASIFDAVLRIAQIEAGTLRANFKPVDVLELTTSLCDTFAPVAEEAEQLIEFQSGCHEPALMPGDKALLTQMFANLIENAIRHAGRGAVIKVQMTLERDKIVVCIADNGPGIPVEEKDNVLQRFYRLDKSRNSEGTGLGLAIVKAIVDLHRAELILEDNQPGLRVCVKLPGDTGHSR